MANTPIPNRAVEYSGYGTSGVREYKLTPEELEEIRQKYPATKRDVNFKKPVAHNPRTDERYLNHEEDKDMGGQRTSKEGPSCGLTKKLFLEQIVAGETVSSIEKAWGMKYNTLYNWVKNWDCRGVTPDKAREMLAQLGEASGYATEPDKTQLLREKEVLASEQRPSTDLEQLNKAVQEIERLTLEVTAKDEVKGVLQRRLDSTEVELIKLRGEVKHWKARAAEAAELADKAAEESTAKIERMKANLQKGTSARHTTEDELVQTTEENDRLRDEINRMISERDELMSENDRLSDLLRVHVRVEPAEPASETQLLDRSIAELTRARKIIKLLSASGE
ncbi:MAG TPA: hypothetical protein VGN87_00735 [Paenibacillus sp.]|jgi:hypothetical protein